jgi:peptide/nickel transport system ATP-binding protein
MVSALVGPTDAEALAAPALRIDESTATTWQSPQAPEAVPRKSETLLSVRDLSVVFPGGLGKPSHQAVHEVSVDIAAGESFGGRRIRLGQDRDLARRHGPATADLRIGALRAGGDLTATPACPVSADSAGLSGSVRLAQARPHHRRLDRRAAHRVPPGAPALGLAELRAKVASLLEEVGLDPGLASAYPEQLSGGMRQRAGIARALSVEPALLIADEPVSALDVSVQAQVLNLLTDLQRQHGLALLFISHDLTVVRHMCTRIAMLAAGSIVELGEREQVLTNPRSDYTRALLDAAPDLERPVGSR